MYYLETMVKKLETEVDWDLGCIFATVRTVSRYRTIGYSLRCSQWSWSLAVNLTGARSMTWPTVNWAVFTTRSCSVSSTSETNSTHNESSPTTICVECSETDVHTELRPIRTNIHQNERKIVIMGRRSFEMWDMVATILIIFQKN